MQSGIGIGQMPNNLAKMAAPGDWPWYVALFRADTHVCDGSLVSLSFLFSLPSQIIFIHFQRFLRIGCLLQTLVFKASPKQFGWLFLGQFVSHLLHHGHNDDALLA